MIRLLLLLPFIVACNVGTAANDGSDRVVTLDDNDKPTRITLRCGDNICGAPGNGGVGNGGGDVAVDPGLEIALGNVEGVTHVNKFGRNPDAVETQDVWNISTPMVLLPEPRLSVMTSGSSADTANGAGCREITVLGLQDWQTPETEENVLLNGQLGATTANRYVIINRMFCIRLGGAGINVGQIDAVDSVDSIPMARIAVGDGQTTKAIWGVPEGQIALVTNYYGTSIRSSIAEFTIRMLVNSNPATPENGWVLKHTMSGINRGSSQVVHRFYPYYRFNGPAIIKLQSDTKSEASSVAAGFDVIVVDVP